MTSSDPAITTDRLTLRPYKDADLAPFAALNADPEVMEFLGGFGLSREESDEIAAGANASFASDGYGKIAVERREDGEFLGFCGLSREIWYPDDLEIGWRLARAHWGHGYATESARAWLAYAFDSLGVPRVIAIGDSPNLRSIAVMEKIGLTFDHAKRLTIGDDSFDARIYSITREHFRSLAR